MFENDRAKVAQPGRASLDDICADYLESLQRALVGARTVPRETRLQHERLSMRFARRIKVGERELVSGRGSRPVSEAID